MVLDMNAKLRQPLQIDASHKYSAGSHGIALLGEIRLSGGRAHVAVSTFGGVYTEANWLYILTRDNNNDNNDNNSPLRTASGHSLTEGELGNRVLLAYDRDTDTPMCRVAAAGVLHLGAGIRWLVIANQGCEELSIMDPSRSHSEKALTVHHELRGSDPIWVEVETDHDDEYPLTLPGHVLETIGVDCIKLSQTPQKFLMPSGRLSEKHRKKRDTFIGRTDKIFVLGEKRRVADVSGRLVQLHERSNVDSEVGGKAYDRAVQDASQSNLVQAALRPAYAFEELTGASEGLPGRVELCGCRVVRTACERSSSCRPSNLTGVAIGHSIQCLACHPEIPLALVGSSDGSISLVKPISRTLLR
uniref:Uncharacterized protein n=1 Tax=Octactis speculum TaxID=3111310 RepID=A0A7S2AIN9_9STRA|mmetsp:Transcript_10644/g.14045  ORF Transcript_10644/g.14045 Transcript_10644/m.14045 type:complete len:359 (+) Transcript_10644:211-1287(+)